jgi:hypothetical protein
VLLLFVQGVVATASGSLHCTRLQDLIKWPAGWLQHLCKVTVAALCAQ